MKTTKILSAITTLSILLTTLFALPFPVSAAEQKINATEVTIYAMEDRYKDAFTIPDNYPQSFTFEVEGAKNVICKFDNFSLNRLKISGSTVSPFINTQYHYGNYVFFAPVDSKTPDKITQNISTGIQEATVIADGVEYPVKVNVVDYAETYYRGVVKEYLDKNITSEMTTREKVEVIAKYVASKDYINGYNSFVTMMYYGGGTCWASTETVVTMAEMIGLKAWWRDGSRDPGAGSLHYNAMVTDGNNYYEVEAGYAGYAPRRYLIKERTDLFSYRYLSDLDGYEATQYDGLSSTKQLIVPESYNGKPIIAIGDKFFMNSEVTEVELPNTVKRIGSRAFSGCSSLEKINIPSGVDTIGASAFAKCRSLSNITATGRIKYENGLLILDKHILLYVMSTETCVVPNGITEIADYALYGSPVKKMYIPESVTKISNDIMCSPHYLTDVYGYKDSFAEEAFKNYNSFLTFHVLSKDMIGDINNDSKIDILDSTIIQKHTVDKQLLTEEKLFFADVNRDGKVDIFDAAKIQKYSAEKINEFKKSA